MNETENSKQIRLNNPARIESLNCLVLGITKREVGVYVICQNRGIKLGWYSKVENDFGRPNEFSLTRFPRDLLRQQYQQATHIYDHRPIFRKLNASLCRKFLLSRLSNQSQSSNRIINRSQHRTLTH